MKSYHSLDECLPNIKKSQFIFKQNQLIKSYSIASLDEIKKSQKANINVIFMNMLIIINQSEFFSILSLIIIKKTLILF